MLKSRKKIFIMTGMLLLIAIAVAGYLRWQLKQGRTSPPPAGKSVMVDKLANASSLPGGFVVWSSNRYGNHELLRMDLPGRNITRLTNHPHTDYFPRISPDGSKVVFSRSQKPWVSQRNQELWDIILLDLVTGKERVLARDANTPTWSADGERVYFQRKVFSLAEVNINTGEEKLIFTSGQGDVAERAGLQTPDFNEKQGKMAVTLRYTQHMTAIVDLAGKITEISDGCQLTWNKAGDMLYYVDHGGKQKNAFYTYDPKTGRSAKWLDLPGNHSHEYFPRLSNDEKFLVFAASTGDHEHDSADYEIFLWEVGSSPDSAVRLTFHTGNDNWPDIYLE